MSTGRQLNRLTHLAVQNLSEPGWHPDGGGLYLEISASGSKRWTLRVRADGRTREFGLGPLHKEPLKAGREAATEYRAKLYKGIDPLAEKRARKVVAPPVAPTFEVCAKEVHRLRKAQLKNTKHIQLWINQLVDYAFPVMRTKPINQVTTADVLAVLSPIWASKPETARRIRQRLRNILDWARASGHRSGDNPVDLIGEALPRQRPTKRHFLHQLHISSRQEPARLHHGHLRSLCAIAGTQLECRRLATLRARNGINFRARSALLAAMVTLREPTGMAVRRVGRAQRYGRPSFDVRFGKTRTVRADIGTKSLGVRSVGR